MEDLIKGELDWHNKVNENFHEVDSQMAEIVLNIKTGGVKGDGNQDEFNAIQAFINNNPNKTIMFPAGLYLIRSPIEISRLNEKSVNLLFDKNAILYTDTNIDHLLGIGLDTSNSFNRFGTNKKMFVTGGVFNCANCNCGIILNSQRQLIDVSYAQIINFKNYGIITDISTDTGSGDANIHDIYLQGLQSNTTDISTAIWNKSYDNEFNDIRIDRCKIAVKIDGGGFLGRNIHATAMFVGDITKEQYEQTIGFDINNTGLTSLIHCYADTFSTGFEQHSTGYVHLQNCITHYYLTNELYETYVVKFDSNNPNFSIINCDLSIPLTGTNHIIYVTDTARGIISNNMLLLGNKYGINETVSKVDLAYSFRLNKQSVYTPYDFYTNLMESDKWYPFAIISANPRSIYECTISMDSSQSTKFFFEYLVNTDNTPRCNILKKENINNHAHNYVFGILNSFTVQGRHFAYLCVKAIADTEAYFNPSISIKSSTGDLFGYNSNFLPFASIPETELLTSSSFTDN